MSGWAYVENIVILLLIAAAIVAGLYFRDSWVGLWALFLLAACNSPTAKGKE